MDLMSKKVLYCLIHSNNVINNFHMFIFWKYASQRLNKTIPYSSATTTTTIVPEIKIPQTVRIRYSAHTPEVIYGIFVLGSACLQPEVDRRK